MPIDRKRKRKPIIVCLSTAEMTMPFTTTAFTIWWHTVEHKIIKSLVRVVVWRRNRWPLWTNIRKSHVWISVLCRSSDKQLSLWPTAQASHQTYGIELDYFDNGVWTGVGGQVETGIAYTGDSGTGLFLGGDTFYDAGEFWWSIRGSSFIIFLTYSILQEVFQLIICKDMLNRRSISVIISTRFIFEGMIQSIVNLILSVYYASLLSLFLLESLSTLSTTPSRASLSKLSISILKIK